MKTTSIRGDLLTPASSVQKPGGQPGAPKGSFGTVLKDTLQEVNKLQLEADQAIRKVETGKSGSLYEAMVALEKADISFRAMMQVRNKIIEAYHEVMRMQV